MAMARDLKAAARGRAPRKPPWPGDPTVGSLPSFESCDMMPGPVRHAESPRADPSMRKVFAALSAAPSRAVGPYPLVVPVTTEDETASGRRPHCYDSLSEPAVGSLSRSPSHCESSQRCGAVVSVAKDEMARCHQNLRGRRFAPVGDLPSRDLSRVALDRLNPVELLPAQLAVALPDAPVPMPMSLQLNKTNPATGNGDSASRLSDELLLLRPWKGAVGGKAAVPGILRLHLRLLSVAEDGTTYKPRRSFAGSPLSPVSPTPSSALSSLVLSPPGLPAGSGRLLSALTSLFRLLSRMALPLRYGGLGLRGWPVPVVLSGAWDNEVALCQLVSLDLSVAFRG